MGALVFTRLVQYDQARNPGFARRLVRGHQPKEVFDVLLVGSVNDPPIEPGFPDSRRFLTEGLLKIADRIRGRKPKPFAPFLPRIKDERPVVLRPVKDSGLERIGSFKQRRFPRSAFPEKDRYVVATWHSAVLMCTIPRLGARIP